mgnify:CR=1 FL=1
MTYSRAVVERAGELRRSGLSCREIARELDGPSKSAVARWTRSVAAGGTVGRAVAKMELPKVVGDGPVYPDIDPDDKDALIERLVLENAVLRAVNDVLKAASLDGMSNREKTLVIDRLRPAGKWSLRELTAFLRISRSSYDYQRRAIARPDRLAPLRALVRRVFLEDGDGARGYRFVVRRLRERGATSARPCRTSCGSPTSPSSGCPPAGRSTCRPSGTASTPRSWRGGPARARTPRSPTRRSRTPARCSRPARAPSSTPTAAGTTAGPAGSRSARGTASPGACRPRAAARTTRRWRASSACSRGSSGTAGTGRTGPPPASSRSSGAGSADTIRRGAAMRSAAARRPSSAPRWEGPRDGPGNRPQFPVTGPKTGNYPLS